MDTKMLLRSPNILNQEIKYFFARIIYESQLCEKRAKTEKIDNMPHLLLDIDWTFYPQKPPLTWAVMTKGEGSAEIGRLRVIRTLRVMYLPTWMVV